MCGLDGFLLGAANSLRKTLRICSARATARFVTCLLSQITAIFHVRHHGDVGAVLGCVLVNRMLAIANRTVFSCKTALAA